MRRFYIWLWLLMLVCGSCTKEKQELRVLHLNIWMEGTVVKNGFEAVADEVARIDPDIVSQRSQQQGRRVVRSPHAGRICAKEGKSIMDKAVRWMSHCCPNTPYWNKRKTFRIKTGY